MTLDRRALIDAIALQHEREPFSGVIYVRERGDVVIEAAYGLAHRAEGIPNTVGTRFGIASGTKTLTSIAVARLVEEGRLDFDARLTERIDATLPEIDPDVTLHHLLTHSAGVPELRYDACPVLAVVDISSARPATRRSCARVRGRSTSPVYRGGRGTLMRCSRCTTMAATDSLRLAPREGRRTAKRPRRAT